MRDRCGPTASRCSAGCRSTRQWRAIPPSARRRSLRSQRSCTTGSSVARQLHEKLRADPRVSVFERMNARTLQELPFAPDLVVCDVSFISVRIALPPALALARPGWEAVILVKPQFEAGRSEVGRGGVVRDIAVRRRVVREIAEVALGWGGETVGVVDSGLPGPKGNREAFLHLVHRERPVLP